MEDVAEVEPVDPNPPPFLPSAREMGEGEGRAPSGEN